MLHVKLASYYTQEGAFVKLLENIFFMEKFPLGRTYCSRRDKEGAERVKTGKILWLAAWLAAFLLWPGPPQELTMTGGATTVELEEGEPPLVALTFDDGPRNSTTGRLLDGLALREVPATFFLVGNRIEGSEELIRRMAADGHQIGIHTFEHVVVSDLSRKDFDLQVGKTRALLAEILGDGEFWLRPPYGLFDSSVRKWADCPIILWSVDPEDWKDKDVDRIVAAVVEHVKDGDIILMHDIFDTSVDAALRVVDNLLSVGYCFVTVEQLMEERQVEPAEGTVFRALPPKGEDGKSSGS